MPLTEGAGRAGETSPRRIVILRALQLGDMLCAVLAMRALRAALPRAEIVLMGLPWAAKFVDRYPRYLDGFREFPGFPGLPERAPEIDRIPAFLEEIRRERFDLAVQMHGNGWLTNPLVTLFGARRVAGFYQPGESCPDPRRFLPYPDRGTEVRRLLALADFSGIRRRVSSWSSPCGSETAGP
jgi:ADP-heptose:LPS heptosyltransferase